jgi:hypothetical protein
MNVYKLNEGSDLNHTRSVSDQGNDISCAEGILFIVIYTEEKRFKTLNHLVAHTTTNHPSHTTRSPYPNVNPG